MSSKASSDKTTASVSSDSKITDSKIAERIKDSESERESIYRVTSTGPYLRSSVPYEEPQWR
jgi:hypothetical protein